MFILLIQCLRVAERSLDSYLGRDDFSFKEKS